MKTPPWPPGAPSPLLAASPPPAPCRAQTPAQRPAAKLPPRRVRSLFLSDFHLGTVGCKAGALLDFLRRHEAETTYLVGDILDHWHLHRGDWTAEHEGVLRLILDRAAAGHRTIYIPGNHDSLFRDDPALAVPGVELCAEAIHRAASGERYLVTHGDCCDIFARRFPLLSRAGSRIEAGVRRAGRALDRLWRGPGGAPGAAADRAILRVNRVVRAWDRFEDRLAALAAARGVDGIICGHFHQAALQQRGGVVYANCGDWIDNCSAVIETAAGRLALVRWQPVPAEPGEADRAAFADALVA